MPNIVLALLVGVCAMNAHPAIAAEGRARVYKIDPLTTPQPEIVTFRELDGSGYLSNPFLSLLVKSPSPYDYRAYSLQNEFVYEPVLWNYYSIFSEGLKFDQASLYYYYSVARNYFESRFGFKQSLDGYHIDRLRVILFHEAADGPVLGVNAGVDARKCVIVTGVPGDPYANIPIPNFYPNFNRTFSGPMHEYTHFVFLRYRQGLQLQNNNPQTDAIAEGLAVFWPCAITNQPHYNRTLWPDSMPEKLIDLRNDVRYDPNDTSTDEQGHLANRNKILSVATALWSLREHPRIGKTNAEKIIYEAMALLPHDNPTLADLSGACVLAKQTLPAQIKGNLSSYIEGTFAKHTIPRKIGSQVCVFTFLEVGNTLPETMRAGEKKTVAISFKNQAPGPRNAPSLISFNPKVNPNADNPGVLTNNAWGITKAIQAPAPVPAGGYVKFYLTLVAPSIPGKYACDWAIKLADGTISYIVSKDIAVGQPQY